MRSSSFIGFIRLTDVCSEFFKTDDIILSSKILKRIVKSNKGTIDQMLPIPSSRDNLNGEPNTCSSHCIEICLWIGCRMFNRCCKDGNNFWDWWISFIIINQLLYWHMIFPKIFTTLLIHSPFKLLWKYLLSISLQYLSE